MEIRPIDKLKLYGFNNLTKTLSFNMYDICYARTRDESQAYIDYVDEEYNADRLTRILTDVSNIIGANILNVAKQDYEPQGASVTMLISEEPLGCGSRDCSGKEVPGPLPDSVAAHLDKSHITVHTYPEIHPDQGISTFRVDLDVSTCGKISPLKALNYLLHAFNPDIAIVDYRVRGFTRDVSGRKIFIDHEINSIQNYIAAEMRDLYQMIDVNVYQENLFHTKMILREFDLDNYLFDTTEQMLLPGERKKIRNRIKKEMQEIFSGMNISQI
ncbi:adenosylmethionine decarboxylase [Aminithiophilus ramosus]|uniref:Adenosylmethionine decarboxylase n=2 Tax=Synergistales TaxID=649776 RepID=A0A9Q7EZI1_9BACT|nr:adenosylmethionine decarboxylase [Aminithiophilus ramosus]QTX33026.1 adenosylmethionine decarboxylase [Aminithiophilus ramosus]QVL37213.1 adenosylmethionine decarboxylase [Synergistota bacterium]